jgi:hypothetical protein
VQTPRILALFAVVAIAGCGAHSTTPSTSSSPTAATLSPAADTNPPARAGRGRWRHRDRRRAAARPGRQPPCAAYDGWRPGPDEAGIAVIYWNAGPDHVTVVVRQQDGPDLSQTADIDTGERMHEFDFIDGTPRLHRSVDHDRRRALLCAGCTISIGATRRDATLLHYIFSPSAVCLGSRQTRPIRSCLT